MTLSKGKFITVEGIEGVGKSTSMNFLKTELRKRGIDFIQTREPGGTPIAEEIRSLLLAHHPETMARDTELLLFFAGRAQHIATVINPALKSGTWVLCDRFTDASYAYQAGGRGISEKRLDTLAHWVQGDLQPDLTLLLVAPVEVALSRANGRSKPDRIELEKTNFFSKVQDAYLRRAKQFSERYRVIDANCPQERVYEQLQKVLDVFIG